MMLMMMASLSTFAQYPTTKKIKGEQVVIMTVKQAEEIDKKFQALEDSIVTLNDELNGCGTSLNFTQNKVEILTDSINNVNDSINKITILYNREIKRIDKLEWIDKKARVRVTTGLAIVLLTWVVGIITSN